MNRAKLSDTWASDSTAGSIWPPFCCPLHPKVALKTIRGIPDGLFCTYCGMHPIRDGIPRLVPAGSWQEEAIWAEAKQWDREANEYDERRGSDGRYMAAIEAAVRNLNVQPTDTVLDAACGTGMTTRRLLASGCRVTGLDLSIESLNWLRDRTAGQTLRVVQGDLTRLPFNDGSFDRVLCANALQQLHESDQRASAVRELARVLKPGGRIVVTAQQYSLPRRWAGWVKEGSTGSRVRYIYRFSREEFAVLLARMANNAKVRGAGFPLPYRFKLGVVSRWVERTLQRPSLPTALADLLVGVVDAPDQAKS